MKTTPRGLRLHIGIFGRRNAGKSSLLNAITGQQAAVVSDVPGTTTDPVEKPMELAPLGPVLFIDTAGIDDQGELGALRMEKTRQAFDRTDIAILAVAAGEWGSFEEKTLQELQARKKAIIVAFNKVDVAAPYEALRSRLKALGIPCVETAAHEGRGIAELRNALAGLADAATFRPLPLMSDLVSAGETVVLVVPIDREAPRGRLILPQAQAIRELLDADVCVVVVQPSRLEEMLQRLTIPPSLVVTDSQALAEVAAATPPQIRLTTFSILMARQKGDFQQFIAGTKAIARLRPGDRVLVAEACTHHPVEDDIGRVKIPRLMQRYVGGELAFDFARGRDFPDDLTPYRLVVHCGACMWNRAEVLARQTVCRTAGVPISNYGMSIACSLGLLDRVLAPLLEADRSAS